MNQTDGSMATGFVSAFLGLLVGVCMGGTCCRKKHIEYAKVAR